MSDVDISVVVCTYNRAGALGEMLETLARQRFVDALRYEVVVVGDGCTDETAVVVENFAPRLPIRFLDEPHGGKSAALNAACRAVRGELVVFVDDDVVLDEKWLFGFRNAAARRPDVDCFQGRVLNRWLCPVPEWLAIEGEFQVRGPIVNGDFGADEIPMKPVRFVGANAAIRLAALREAGEFRTDVGPGHPVAGLNEDTDLALRLERNNRRCVYLPAATVHHPVPPERATQKYFKKWAMSCGRSAARVFPGYRHTTKLLGMPRYVVRRYLENRFLQFVFLIRGNRTASFYFKMNSWLTAAALIETRSWSTK